MKVINLMGILLLMSGCSYGSLEKSSSTSPYAFSCEGVEMNIERCENKEIICYKYYQGGLQCNTK